MSLIFFLNTHISFLTCLAKKFSFEHIMLKMDLNHEHLTCWKANILKYFSFIILVPYDLKNHAFFNISK